MTDKSSMRSLIDRRMGIGFSRQHNRSMAGWLEGVDQLSSSALALLGDRFRSYLSTRAVTANSLLA